MVAETYLWTVEKLDVLPDDGGWTRYEIIDGELLMTRAPHRLHQDVAVKLSTRLDVWSEKTQLGQVYQAPGLVFTRQNAVIPDLILISNDRIANGVDDAGHFTVAPELVVEILSPGKHNEERDRDTKLKFYSRHGVDEYWIASWQQQAIEVYRRTESGLEFVNTLGIEDTLSSPLLPGFSTPVARIFG